MDERLWRLIRRTIRSVERSLPHPARRRPFGDELIVKMYFWSVAHDRPLCWACSRESYGRHMHPKRIPSVSQFCKRLKTRRVEAIIDGVNRRLAGRDAPAQEVFIDGKALPISESSRDPDARTGRGNGRFSRGYKMHALGDARGKIRAFLVRPMNEGEPPIAREHLVRHISGGAIVLADGNYDGAELYSAVGARGATLFTPQKKNRRTERAYRRTCPERRAAMDLWTHEPARALRLYRRRAQIERIFGTLTCVGGGLGPLPAWVRRLERVTRWVTAKVALHNARVTLRTTPS
jgi:transposase